MRLALIVWALTASPGWAGKPPSAEELINQARSALDKGHAAEALSLAEKAIDIDPKESRGWALRGFIYDGLEKYDRAVADYTKALTLNPKMAQAYDGRGTSYFKLGQITKCLPDFDRFLELQPAAKAGHWRRGIALYYAGRFEDGQKQFEGYQTVDANDVENVVWRCLCMARRVGPAKARAAMLKIGKDKRVPMMEIYALFCGRATPADVLAAAGTDDSKREARFYAHLYLGLYYESEGDAKKALDHLSRAVDLRIGHYMWHVARVHKQLLQPK